VAAAVVAGARTRTRRALLVETNNVCFITSPELTVVVLTGDAQLVFVIDQNTEVLSCTHLLHATIDNFHEVYIFCGFCPIPELTVVVPTRAPHTAICLQKQAVVPACSHGLHATIDDFFPMRLLVIVYGPIPVRTMYFLTRGPHTAICLQHVGEVVSC